MSAELFHVIACIIRRLIRDRATVPLSTRYDNIERTTSDPQPFLFQRHIGQRNEVMTPGAVNEMLHRTCTKLAEQHPQFAGTALHPARLPPAVRDRPGQPRPAHPHRRRPARAPQPRSRPAATSPCSTKTSSATTKPTSPAAARCARPRSTGRVTDAEWAEFEEHFDKRKLELGNCARPYATPCQHEHACIRCPMLRVDPKMLARLEEIETDLLARRARAEAEGWLRRTRRHRSHPALPRRQTRRHLAPRPAQPRPATPLGMPTIGAPA